MKIALDLMGGDEGLRSNLKGAKLALNEFNDIQIFLVGKEEEIKEALNEEKLDLNRVNIVPASEVISNNENPAMAIRKKKDSSIVKGMNLLKDGEVDAFVSSGSTGALLSGGIFIVKRIKGIERPSIGFIYPKLNGEGFLLDAGANSECKDKYLKQFAIMGNIYAKAIMKKNDPKIGLINIGSEKEKGTELYKNAHNLIENTEGINFLGNIEPRDIFETKADVLVCDGFTGNVILKSLEGMVDFIFSSLKEALTSSIKAKIGVMMLKSDLRDMKDKLSYNDYGGAPLLGLKKPVIKAHGNSDAMTIKNAIRQARDIVNYNISEKIEKEMEQENEN